MELFSYFNNLSEEMLPCAVQAAQTAIERLCPDARNVLLIPERHTRNTFYLSNVATLVRILRQSGLEVRIGSLADDLTETQVVQGLRRAAGTRFENQFAHVGARQTFASAYHIKVAVRDRQSFWLSSGNWQSSNQPDIDFLDVDADRMHQVIENLVANAIQHSPRDATVRVAAGLFSTGQTGTMRFVVEDEGPGIPEAHLARLFEPFFTRREGGTGLGLSIVQRIVEAHGGRVSIENRSPGAAFAVTLPLREA
jgi:light-regulated signal transduction histidine kinase (bacteriophytochrome)